jgi:heparosan-N-sulfate-glucuronate 5-epimerase
MRGTRSSVLVRPVQAIGKFEPGDPQSGYYNDLRRIAATHGSPDAALAALHRLTAAREEANATSIAQLGLAAWQLRGRDAEWLRVTDAAARWLAGQLDDGGGLAYFFPMPHTYRVRPPWFSAMAQGEAASLLVRASATDAAFGDAATRAVLPLLEREHGLVAETAEGPVLQEYPTAPPAHVLNGWIFGLWGLYDVSLTGSGRAGDAARAFSDGVAAVAARLPLYDAGLDWSRYDLFPHPLVHVASPFYQRLHAEQLLATARLRPDLPLLAATGARWRRAAGRPLPRAVAVARKGAFRLVRPRRRLV